MSDDLLVAAVRQLQREVKALQREVSRLRRVEAAGGGPVMDTPFSNPPTDAELDSAFGVPGDISQGMIKFVDDDGAETDVYLVVAIGDSWWIFTGVKAT